MASTVKYAELIIRFRWLVIFLTIAAAILTGYGAKNLAFTSDYRVWFDEDNPERMAFEKLQNTYTRNDNVLFVLKPKDGNVFSKETLRAVQQITKESWQIPFSIRVDSITNYQHTHAIGDNLIVEDLVLDIDELTDKELKEKRATALNEPMLVSRVISKDGKTTGVNVITQLPQISSSESAEVMAYARKISEEVAREYPDIKIALTGLVPLNNAFLEVSQKDMGTLAPMMYVIILVFCFFLLRSLSAMISVFLVIGFSTATAMGLAGWMGIQLTPGSSTAPTIILTLAVADSIHILVTMLKELRHGRSKNEAIVESMRINMHPVFLTSITTVIGFLALNASDAPPFHDLGNMSAIGVTAAYIYSITFLPAFMSILPVRVPKDKKYLSLHLIESIADFVIKFRKLLLVSIGSAVIVFAALIPSIELNDKFIEYFDESVKFRNDSDFAQEHLSGSYQIEFSLEYDKESGLAEPEFLEDIEAFTNWLRSQPEVDHVNTISDTFKRLNKNMHEDQASWYRLPDNKELAAQYLLLYEFSLPYGLDLNNQIDISKTATRITVTLKNISTVEFRQFNDKSNNWIENRSMRYKETLIKSDGGTGATLMFAYISERNINGMLIGTTISLFLISLILIFALKSFSHGLVSLIPNLIPAVMAFGIWSIFVGQIGMGISIVIAMCLGIIVDDTVHFLSKYLRGIREKGLSGEEAVRYAFNTAGLALLVTSVVIIAGFLMLGTSDFKVNSYMGILNSIIITMALITDFLLLPPILMILDKKRKGKKQK